MAESAAAEGATWAAVATDRETDLLLRDNEEDELRLWNAAAKGNLAGCQMALNLGIHIDSPGMEQSTPLFIACQKGHLDIVQLLLENKCNLDKARDDGRTPLFTACQEGHHGIVTLLPEHGCDVHKAANIGQTVLDAACFHISTVLSQVGNTTSEVGAERCLVLLLASRRMDRQMLVHTAVKFQKMVPSKQEMTEAEASGVALHPQKEMARLVVPVLKAQLRNERRWCAWCFRMTPDHDLNTCKVCDLTVWSVGYCDKDCQKKGWKKGGHKQECVGARVAVAVEGVK